MADPQSVTLAASATRTTSAEGSAVDGGANGRSAGISLAVTATTGGTLTVLVEGSETGLGDWTTLATFPEVDGVTNLKLVFANPERYIRASWTIGGSSPSFTFSVSGKLYSHLITRNQIDAHMGARIVARVLDDSGAGDADEDAVNSLLAYASSMLRGKLGTVDDLSGLNPEVQSEMIRIGLDICHARAAIRHPEVVRLDGMKMMDAAKKDLRDIVLHGATAGVPNRPPVEAYAAGVISTESRGW